MHTYYCLNVIFVDIQGFCVHTSGYNRQRKQILCTRNPKLCVKMWLCLILDCCKQIGCYKIISGLGFLEHY